MISIAFYISDHGFGHAARNIPIIRYILKSKKDLRVYIKTGTDQGNFIKNCLKDLNTFNNVEFILKKVDLGLVLKKNSFSIDKILLNKNVSEFINTWDEEIIKDKKFILEKKIQLIVSDIVPWIFIAACDLNIKSLLVSNFTWIDIYKEYIEYKLCEKFEECYKKADKVYLYNLYMDSLTSYIDEFDNIGLICREFNFKKIEEIKNKYENPIVFISVGRSVQVDKIFDVNNLKYHFIVTKGINVIGKNVTYLSKDTVNTQDYIKASDYIITKAGWTTVAECLIAKKKFAVISREDVAEDRNTINKLIKNNLAIKCDYKNLDIEKVINDLKKFSPSFEKINTENNYKYIGEKILNLL